MLLVSRELILASASPQRRQLLEGLSIPFEVCVTGVEDESDVSHTDPVERAQFFARKKAERARAVHPDAWIIGCDTLVVASDSTLLEKPKNAEEARAMIQLQSGKTSLVHSGLCVMNPQGKVQEGLSTSSVMFKRLSPQEVDWWISTQLWEGRSGSFQIDGPGQLMIERLEGGLVFGCGVAGVFAGGVTEEVGMGYFKDVIFVLSWRMKFVLWLICPFFVRRDKERTKESAAPMSPSAIAATSARFRRFFCVVLFRTGYVFVFT